MFHLIFVFEKDWIVRNWFIISRVQWFMTWEVVIDFVWDWLCFSFCKENKIFTWFIPHFDLIAWKRTLHWVHLWGDMDLKIVHNFLLCCSSFHLDLIRRIYSWLDLTFYLLHSFTAIFLSYRFSISIFITKFINWKDFHYFINQNITY